MQPQLNSQPELAMGVRWPSRIPLGSLDICAWELQTTRDNVIPMIDSGRLAWAWHMESLRSMRRCLRVWRESLMALKLGVPQPDDTPDAVAANILPVGRPWLSVQELHQRWMLSSGHLTDLIDQGELAVTSDSPWGRGAGNSPRITRESAAAFLRRRRVGAA